MKQWEGFKGDKWRTSVDTRDFIQNNYTEYKGDDSFLEPIAPSTDKLWTKLQELFEIQHEKNGVYDMDSDIPATITSHEPGYLIKEGVFDAYTAEMRLARKTKSLLVFQMLMAVAVLSVTIVVSHYTTT